MPNQANQLNNKILDFLEGKLNYNVGLSLFMRISTDKDVLLTLFGLETPAKKKLLTQELKKYYNEENNYQQLGERQSESLSHFTEDNSSSRNDVESNENSFPWSNNYRYTSANLAGENDSIKNHLHKERRRLYDLRKALGSDLFNAVSDENRHKIAESIMDVCEDIDELHEDLSKLESGLIPEKFIKKSRSADEFVKIQNTQKYIRAYQSKLKKTKDLKEIENIQKLIEKHERNLKSLIDA